MAKHTHPTPPTPFHSMVVTQQGPWLAMDPVSHPASINLTPHPSAQLYTPPSASSTKWPTESVRGIGRLGGPSCEDGGRPSVSPSPPHLAPAQEMWITVFHNLADNETRD
ncbi:unnamed protein product [Pleuronectes platessa]|uniref:Uncharacterized protein n=1 Tax=Pleuronectes platessa TaxID=8262 RepID=A0A9N7YF83_PLEPL|nr:unnamed protein product [Pleuronectes platessa]